MRTVIFFCTSMIIMAIYRVGDAIAPNKGLMKLAWAWLIFAFVALLSQIISTF